MTELEVAKWVVTAVLAGFIWFLKRTIDLNDSKIKSMEEEIKNIRENFLHKNDFVQFKTELREMFAELKQDIRELKK